MCEEAALAPELKSLFSTRVTSTPCRLSSLKVEMPLIPPPMIRTLALGFALSFSSLELLVPITYYLPSPK
jgi:hypothetical protein